MTTTTNFTVVAADSFTGSLVTADSFVGTLTGGQIMPAATVRSGADAANLIIDPGLKYVSLTKATAGSYTLAAPGAANVGNRMIIINGSTAANVVTVTGLVGGTTLTFTTAIGHACELLAVSATVWTLLASKGVTQS